MRSTIFSVCLAATSLLPVTLLACGYDNPQSISLGSLNWVYPDALHVRTAVANAESAGLLPVEKPGTESGPFAFYRATATMKAFGTKLTDPHLREAGIAVSVVLIPQAMWTRFEISSNGIIMQGHADGPLESDVVMVTEEVVVRLLINGSLAAAAAEQTGLLRFYGDPGHVEKARAALTRINGDSPTLPVRFANPTPKDLAPSGGLSSENLADF